jgi:hypothetical protein
MRSSFRDSEAVLLLDEGVQVVVCLSAPPLIWSFSGRRSSVIPSMRRNRFRPVHLSEALQLERRLGLG